MARQVTPTRVLLNTITLSAASASITLSNIPQNYSDLILVATGSGSVYSVVYVEFNGDTGANYYRVLAYNLGSTSGTDKGCFHMNTSQMTSSLEIFDYSASDKHKSYYARTSDPSGEVWMGGHRWNSTSAITSIKAYKTSGNFNIGCTFSLYGVYA